MIKMKIQNVLKKMSILFPGLIIILFIGSCGMSPDEDPLKDNVIKADLILLVTATDQKYEVVQGGQGEYAGTFTYTIYTLSIEKIIKGKVATKEIFLKVSGGPYQGGFNFEPHFNLSDRALICLKNGIDNIYLPLGSGKPDDGVLWIKSLSINSVEKLDDIIGRVIRIMQAYDIPIALPSSEFPS
jgi:hypothetical protein